MTVRLELNIHGESNRIEITLHLLWRITRTMSPGRSLPPYRLATIDMGRKVGWCTPFRGESWVSI